MSQIFNLDDFLQIDSRRVAAMQQDLARVLRVAADIVEQQDKRLAEFVDHAGQARLATTAAALWIALTDVLMGIEPPGPMVR